MSQWSRSRRESRAREMPDASAVMVKGTEAYYAIRLLTGPHRPPLDHHHRLGCGRVMVVRRRLDEAIVLASSSDMANRLLELAAAQLRRRVGRPEP